MNGTTDIIVMRKGAHALSKNHVLAQRHLSLILRILRISHVCVSYSWLQTK